MPSSSHPDCFLNLLSCIQDIGIYIWCDQDNTYISGWQGFLDTYQPPGTTTTTTSTTLTLPLSTTTTSTVKCKSPLEHLLNIVNEIAEEENITICEALTNSLINIVIAIPKSENYCCPDCSDVYFLGSVENFIRFQGTFNYDCCTNISATIETYLKSFEATGNLNTCCNGFTDCIDKLFEHNIDKCDNCNYSPDSQELNIVLDKGIVEYSTIGGQSLFCELVNTYINNH